MKVELDTRSCKSYGNHSRRTVRWKRSLPFHINPRGVLAHRLRWVHAHYDGSRLRHITFGYWCGNMSHRGGPVGDPRPRLLCTRCEAMAKEAGHPSADELVGEHVHVGKVRPQRLCCKELEQ